METRMEGGHDEEGREKSEAEKEIKKHGNEMGTETQLDSEGCERSREKKKQECEREGSEEQQQQHHACCSGRDL